MRFKRVQLGMAVCCLVIAGCVPAPQPVPAPEPTPAPRPAPPPTVPAPAPVASYDHWLDVPATPGNWTYRNGTALFSDPAGGALLAMRCDRAAGAVEIVRAGQVTAVEMIIRAETMERGLSGKAAPAGVAALVPARDPLLDAMAFSKGRFAVEVAGLPTLYAPAYPEVTRVIEDCR